MSPLVGLPPALLARSDALAIPLAAESVDLIIESPPYWSLRAYQDAGGFVHGQVGAEESPEDFLVALWRHLDECWRVLKSGGSLFVNLGDKYAGSGGHNNASLSTAGTTRHGMSHGSFTGRASAEVARVARGPAARQGADGQMADRGIAAARRDAPSRYLQATGGARNKSLIGLPERFMLGATIPDPYRVMYDPGDWPQWIRRADIVWDKPNGLPESVADRVRRSHEIWFHFTKERFYYSNVDDIREPHAPGTAERYAAGYGDRSAYDAERATTGYQLGGDWTLNERGKLPGSVWRITTEPLVIPDYHVDFADGTWQLLTAKQVWQETRMQTDAGDWSPILVRDFDHYAAFPIEWPRRLILGWSPPGICTVCGEGRRLLRGRLCECDTIIEAHAKTCPDCGARRGSEWKAGRVGRDEFRTEDGKPGLHVPRKPHATREAEEMGGYICDCPAPDAPTRPAVVLDPFSGTGTTAMVARALGRTGIGLDLSLDYCRLGSWRVHDSAGGSKARERTNRAAQSSLGETARPVGP